MKPIGMGAALALAVVVGMVAWVGIGGRPLVAQSAIEADGKIESTVGGFVFPDGSVQTTAALAVSAPVEDTGQQACWDATGASIACPGTGQDGALQPGVDWPTPRFADNLDGTVTDNLTGLIWHGLMSGQCGLADGSVGGEWRLPNVKELLTLVDYSEWNPTLPSGHPFDNVQSASYWSSTSGPDLTRNEAWVVFMSFGYNSLSGSKTGIRSVWPVRGGH
jgi:hypothetical protein